MGVLLDTWKGKTAEQKGETVSAAAGILAAGVSAVGAKTSGGAMKSNAVAGIAKGLSGAATGAKLGSALGPLGTGIGAGIGLLAGGISGILGNKKAKEEEEKMLLEANKLQNKSDMLATQARVEADETLIQGNDIDSVFAKGGKLKQLATDSYEVVGPSHAKGGVKLPAYGAEVEGEETIAGEFVFSKELGYADKHKKIANRIGKIEKRGSLNKYEKNTIKALEEQVEKLAIEQEAEKAANGLDNDLNTMKTGGKLRRLAEGGPISRKEQQNRTMFKNYIPKGNEDYVPTASTKYDTSQDRPMVHIGMGANKREVSTDLVRSTIDKNPNFFKGVDQSNYAKLQETLQKEYRNQGLGVSILNNLVLRDNGADPTGKEVVNFEDSQAVATMKKGGKLRKLVDGGGLGPLKSKENPKVDPDTYVNSLLPSTIKRVTPVEASAREFKDLLKPTAPSSVPALSSVTTLKPVLSYQSAMKQKKYTKQTNVIETVAPFIDNIANAGMKLPKVPQPTSNKPVSLRKLTADAELGEAKANQRTENLYIDQALSSSNARAAARASSAATRIKESNRVISEVNRANTEITNQETIANAQIEQGNNARKDQAAQQQAERTMAQQTRSSENIANLVNKLNVQKQDAKKEDLDMLKVVAGVIATDTDGVALRKLKSVIESMPKAAQNKVIAAWTSDKQEGKAKGGKLRKLIQ